MRTSPTCGGWRNLGSFRQDLERYTLFCSFSRVCMPQRPCTSEGLPHYSHLCHLTHYTNTTSSMRAFWFEQLSQGYPRAEPQRSGGMVEWLRVCACAWQRQGGSCCQAALPPAGDTQTPSEATSNHPSARGVPMPAPPPGASLVGLYHVPSGTSIGHICCLLLCWILSSDPS